MLKEAGWTSFTSRTARRFFDSRVEVINFQSLNSYSASVFGCTTYSFSIRLGCFLRGIPYPVVKIKDGLLMPEEYSCHLRRTLLKKFSQPECERSEVFYVDSDGRYLATVTEAARDGIAKQAFEWFQRFSDMQEVLRTLLEDDETMDGTWGFGRITSPARHLCRGYVALSLGDTKLAVKDLTCVASSPCYAELRERIESDLARMS